jgi:uncharacterized protein (TIGR03437 family)
MSIYGASLAPTLEVGPSSPLAQTIAGVIVRLGDRLLPLFFVSPEQINALLPSDLEDGEHTLTVRWEGQPEASVTFSVARNVPGLFTHPVDSRPFVAATHEDGGVITVESPARLGEVVTLFGTGFGPYESSPPDGFVIPESANFPLADPVEILVGDLSILPQWAGAATGYVGVTAVHLRITAELPASSTIELKMKINDRETNTVLLPVE